jgi:hypothetical protein
MKLQYSNDLNYQEADKLRIKIEEIKKTLVQKKVKNLEAQHEKEIKLLDDKFGSETEEFDVNFNARMKEYQANSKQSEEEMNIRHKKEMDALMKNIEANPPKKMKYPPQWLHLKRSEELMAKQNRFQEADFAKFQRLNIEKAEEEKHGSANDKTNKAQIEKLITKQNLEKATLRKKIEVGAENLQKEKIKNVER